MVRRHFNNMAPRKLLVAVVILWSFTIKYAQSQDYCYSLDPEPSSRLSVYNSYFPVENSNDEPITYPGCTARSFWTFFRHGSRNPYTNELRDDIAVLPDLQAQIIQNHNEGRGTLCQRDFDLLASWTQDVAPDQAGNLMGSGYVEMEEMGRRYRARLPDLLQLPYDQNKTIVRSTAYQRTEESLRAYMAGIFAEHPDNLFIPEALDPDPFLRFYDFCNKYTEEVINNPLTYVEQEMFIASSQEINDTLTNINHRLGFEDQNMLGYSEAFSMYDTCRFDRSRKPNSPSPWCVAFEEEDILVMEYSVDLRLWYRGSYGSEFNTQFACPFVSDMVEKFSQEDNQIPRVILYSGHSTALALTLTTLGIFHDEVPLLHDNYEDQEFISSYQIANAGNVEFILFYCDEGDHELTKRILFSYNERPLVLPGCSEELCLLDEYISYNQQSALCPFDQICEN